MRLFPNETCRNKTENRRELGNNHDNQEIPYKIVAKFTNSNIYDMI